MYDKEHVLIPKLKKQLDEKAIGRREFVRYASLLGMTTTAAYALAGKISGTSFIEPAKAQAIPKGGILRIGMRVPKIDSPHTFSWVYDSNILRGVCGYVTRTGADNITRPHLAESWKASDDLKTWTFKIRDIKWHSGKPFTAEDVAWNIKHCLDPTTGSSVLGLMKGYMLNEVDSGEKNDDGSAKMTTELWDANAIRVVDDRTLELNLKNANVAVPEHMFHYPLGMLDPEEGGKFGAGSNGTEAFELVELEVGKIAKLKSRGTHYAEGPYLDEIHFIDLGDDASAVTKAMASKQIDGFYEGNVEQINQYQQMDHVTIYPATTANTAVVRMQVDRPEFKDERVRKAVRLAVDQDQVLKIAARGVGSMAEHHHVCPVHPDYKKLAFHERNVEEAKKLLKEAGAEGLELEIATKKDPSWELAAVQTMAQQWKEAGINVKINVMPSSKFWEVWDKVPFGFTYWTHRPLGFMVLALAYRSGVPWNETHFNHSEFDRILTKAEGTIDIGERTEIMGQLEEIMQEEGPIAQPIWIGIFAAYDKKVKGFTMHPTKYIFGETLGVES